MKVTGWTDYESDLPKLPDELYHEAEKAVIDVLKNKGYRFSGYDHQSHRYGTPIIDNRYKFTCSCKERGGIMATASRSEKWRDYLLWTWSVVEGETILPDSGKESLL